jgi:hypothetical protein
MARVYKVLGQVNPSATTASALYTNPAATETVISTITVCNLSSSAATYRLFVRPNDETLANKHYIAFDSTVGGNDTVALTLGITTDELDVLYCYASTASVAFGVFGTQIS